MPIFCNIDIRVDGRSQIYGVAFLWLYSIRCIMKELENIAFSGHGKKWHKFSITQPRFK